MRTIEIDRDGSVSVTEHLAEMNAWLGEAGVVPLELAPIEILHARVRFRASFATDAEAERFQRRFGGPSDPEDS